MKIAQLWIGALALLFSSMSFAAVTYTYDSLDRLTGVDYGNGNAVAYTYDSAGNMMSASVGTTGPTCTPPTISPASQIAGVGGLSGTVSVTAGSGCAWSASSNASWLTITSGSSGYGNGTVIYSVAANTGNSPRTGTLTIAGQTFTITQWGAAGASCVSGADTDGDGMPDCEELNEGTNLLVKDNDIFTNARLFAMQQYRDFLTREGDSGGISAWTNNITSGAYTRAQVIENFFNSAEFQGVASPVVRLYFAYFLRIPDYEGLQHWLIQYRAGMSLDNISGAFAGSPEFITTYGALSNGQFVTLVYGNVLGRAPDPAGFAYWVGQLDSGAMNRGQIMLGFSESPEYQAESYSSVYVTMMYVGMLRRSPDAGGFNYWVTSMNAGLSGLGLIDSFIMATEYRGRFL